MNPLVSQRLNNPPILIVDEEGIIGEKIASRLSQEAQVVLVTSKEIQPSQNLIHVPFGKPNPLIPDSFYSHIILISPENFSDSVLSFLDKAREDYSAFIVCSYFRNIDSVLKYNFQDYRGTKLIFFGEVFGQKPLILKETSIVNRFINQAKTRGRIDIPGDGLNLSYPIYEDDLIDGILEGVFGLANEKIYYLFPKHGLTFLALANLIQRCDPSIKINFITDENIKDPKISFPGAYLLPDNYKPDKKFSLLKIKAGDFKRSDFPLELKLTKELNVFRVLIFSFLFFLFLPIITTLVFSLLGELFLGSSRTSLSGRQTLSLAKDFFDLSSQTSKVLAFETQFVPFSFSDRIQGLIEGGIKESTGIMEFYKAEDAIFSGKAKEGVSHLNNFILFEESQKSTSGKYSVVDENLFNTISSTFAVLPQILGFEGQKSYLLILTNSQKIRPGGGEIEAFATFGLNNGRLTDFVVQKPSDSDQKLKGHVEPPFPLRRYLSKTNLFFKDSNFSPDFTESASSSAFFINTEQGMSIDGVFAIDTNFIKKVLESSPIYLKKLNIEISLTNIDGLLKEHENDEDFFAQILEGLKDKLSENPNILVSNLSHSLIDKSLLVSFADSKMQNLFTLNNFSGSLWDNREENQNSFADFIGIIDSNFGNPGILQKRAQKNVNINDDRSVVNNLTVQYQGLDSDRKVYLQFILPAATTLNKVKIDGVDKEIVDAETDPSIYEAKDFQPPKGLEIEKSQDKGKLVFGFLVTIPQDKTMTVEIDYSSQGKIQTGANFSYDLRIFKQVGGEAYPLSVVLNYPASFAAGVTPKGSKTEDGKLSSSKTIDRDFDLNFNFIKK